MTKRKLKQPCKAQHVPKRRQASVAHRHEDRAALVRHAAMLVRAAREGVSEPDDRRAVEQRFEAAMRVLKARSAGGDAAVAPQWG